MADLAQLLAWRARLSEARFAGLRSVRDSSGEEVVYQSERELARALHALDAEISALEGRPASIVYPIVSKGL